MSAAISTTVRGVAGIVIAFSAWQPVLADDDTTKRADEARLVLMEEHVREIAAAVDKFGKLGGTARVNDALIAQAAVDTHVDAFDAIVTGYFLGRRIKPLTSGDEPAQTKTLQCVSLLHQMSVQTTRCREGSADEACKTLVSLIEAFRAAINDEDTPSETSKASPNKTPADEKKESRPEKSGDDAKAEVDFQISEAEILLFKIVNAYRKKQGLAPVRLDEKLCQAARDHSGDMKKHGFFSHQSPVVGRTRFTDRADNHGATANAENIARDCKDARMAMKLWVNSQHHRENIVGPHTRIGIGVDENGFYTQVFGK